MTRKKIGLALGSGGFRGFAHVGIIKVLQDNNIPIDFISGASIGSLVGAYYSVFKELKTLEREIINPDKGGLPNLFDLGLRGGFIRGKKFERFLDKILKDFDFHDTQIPLRIVATDLISGQPYVFSSGKLASAVRSSTAVPVVFKPARVKGKLLVDGGLSDPVPVDILRTMGADIIIAVNLYHQNEFIDRHFTMIKVALRSTRIAIHNLSKHSIQNADIVLNPDISSFVHSTGIREYFDPVIAAKIIKTGAKEMEKFLPQIRKICGLVDNK